ncbi:hypothetical protein [Saccharothrix sp. NRRL B-16348]|uniref:hypothetical protein n=1 Tax=Saccharothrix sp. NRRL B-16348 TaxID=1415542 RepID=UPI0018D0E24F|nr:hypothetical protein [Saccharothrix sp. NRRL B-16348]
MSSSKNGHRPHPRIRRNRPSDDVPELLPQQPVQPEVPGQLDLFARVPVVDTARRYGFPAPGDGRQAAHLDRLAVEHAVLHGWSTYRTYRARVAIRVLLGMRDTTDMPITTHEVDRLRTVALPVEAVSAILTSADLLHDDRPDSLRLWFDDQIRDLPDVLADELRIWFDVMRHGSTTPPRRRHRSEITIRYHTRSAMPILHAWASTGTRSLRQIGRQDVLEALPTTGNPRTQAGRAFRSIFTILKGRKLIFQNPMARMRFEQYTRRTPLPINPEQMRVLLDSPDPTAAALAALTAFHGLRPAELRTLQLNDFRDSRLYLTDRTVPLAPLVLQRLADYLDHRYRRWPNSLNPHLFVNYKSACTVDPVHTNWPRKRLGTAPTAIRRDRIVDEVISTGGDLRRVCDFFGVTMATAVHYGTVLEHPDLTNDHLGSPNPRVK